MILQSAIYSEAVILQILIWTVISATSISGLQYISFLHNGAKLLSSMDYQCIRNTEQQDGKKKNGAS